MDCEYRPIIATSVRNVPDYEICLAANLPLERPALTDVRKSVRLIGALLALSVLFFFSNFQADCAAPRTQAERVWLAPAFPFPGKPGLDEILRLFIDEQDWENARSHINVFQIYTHSIHSLPDDELQNIFQYLKRHHIDLALEYGILASDPNCGVGVEGFQPPKMPTLVADKIKRLGGELKYIAMDEPLFYARYYNGARACHWSIDEIARSAASNVSQFRAVFPNVVIGQIEPVSAMKDKGWRADLAEWFKSYRMATGMPIAFFHFDMVWRGPFIENTRQALALLRSENIPFGVIFNSRGDVKSDQEWTDSATANIRMYFSADFPKPSDVIVQSWHPNPTRVLPETDPHALTYLVNYYFAYTKR
jgi:hypothetical protein